MLLDLHRCVVYAIGLVLDVIFLLLEEREHGMLVECEGVYDDVHLLGFDR